MNQKDGGRKLDASDGNQPGECRGYVRVLTPSSNTFELFTEGDELYKTMLAAIASAQQCVDLESYIFADDEVGWWFAEALAERAQAGVKIRVHIDAAGSLFWASRRLKTYLRQQGVVVKWFHRWSWRRPWRYNRRNHRKLLVVDNRRAYLGGFNIHRENSLAVYGEERWRDTHIGIEGSLAGVASQLFAAFWYGDRRWLADVGKSDSYLLHNHTLTCRHRLRCVFSDTFASARQYVFLTTPYFVPDHIIQRGLKAAAQRGVDVRLLVPQKSDLRITQWAARAAYARLLAAGVRIYEYLPRVLHAKTIVVDGEWMMVGTANLDYRSLFVNYELNLVSRNIDLSSQLKQQFLADLDEAEQIKPLQWSKRGWRSRLSETVAWLARRWL